MKRLFVSAPVTLLILFLLYSFVLKEKKAANIVFKSSDGGKTWQDISKGLPENLKKDSIRGNSFFANDKGLFMRFENGIYHSTPDATGPFWTKGIFPDERSGIAPYSNYWSINLKKANGTEVWLPIFESHKDPRMRIAFETAGGTIFIGLEKGFFKIADNGRTWKLVHTGSLVGHMAESNGVLVGISTRGIIRSTDNGENWAVVSNEGVVAWDVKQIKGGFAAITSSSESGTRSLRTSYDEGKTWQPIGTGPQDKVFKDSISRTWNNRPDSRALMTQIIQIGESFICTHHDGIFRSTDKGKTWKLLLPSVEDKVFSLFVSGKVIYAIPSRGGC